jgi:CRISPR-associated endonuclease/helicase Cas3
VLCNQVERAQTMFEALRRSAPDGVEVWLLHSRFKADDRKRIEAQIRGRFGNPTDDGDPTGSVILVATQVIEVGLDITSQVIHTELAPANAIIQRAGRCARYQGETGDVYIYRHTCDTDGAQIDLAEDFMPYEGQKDIIQRTWEAFSAAQGTLDYVAELGVIDQAHGEADQRICAMLDSGSSEHRQKMLGVMLGGKDQRERASGLIREVSQQKIVIHDNPKALLEQLAETRLSPYSLEGFGLHFGTAAKYAKAWLDRPLDEEPSFRVAMLSGQPDVEQNNRIAYKILPVTPGQKFAGAAVVFVHPDLASYDPALGFVPQVGRPLVHAAEPPLGDNTDKPDEPYGYQLETYEQHIARVHSEFSDVVWHEVQYAAARIERKYGLPGGSLHQAANLAVVLHDTGKLNVKWQAWVNAWQKFIGLAGELREGAAYAHTDNHTHEHRRAEREFRGKARRPSHAVEGAVAALHIFSKAVEGEETLGKAIFAAIARHHTPDADSFQPPVHFEAGAVRRTQQLLAHFLPELRVEVRFPDATEQKEIAMGINDVLPAMGKDQEVEHFVAMLLARVLRRADQRGTQVGTVKH